MLTSYGYVPQSALLLGFEGVDRRGERSALTVTFARCVGRGEGPLYGAQESLTVDDPSQIRELIAAVEGGYSTLLDAAIARSTSQK